MLLQLASKIMKLLKFVVLTVVVRLAEKMQLIPEDYA